MKNQSHPSPRDPLSAVKLSPKSRNYSTRARLILALTQVGSGQSLSTILPQMMPQVSERDRGFFHELLYGTLRQWVFIESMIQPMLKQKPADFSVYAAMILGVYQLQFTRVAPHAAIGETVEALKKLGLSKASGLLNAILRRVQREITPSQLHSDAIERLPHWLASQLQQDWPMYDATLAQQLLTPAPIALRVNGKQTARDEYLRQLQAALIQARASVLSDDGIVLQQAVNITSLPNFAIGQISVQDEHAQLVCQLLGDLNDKVVLDMCAAPGGKTAHILERYQPTQLIALDISAQRLLRVSENLQRLQLNTAACQCVAADALHWQQSNQQFDVILLDAPCSATGVIRRHPDILLLRRAEDIAQTVVLQQQLLHQAWQWLKPGGVLVYVTCSLLKQENELQMGRFLAHTADARELTIDANWGIACAVGRQCLPLAPEQGDGFYFARLQRLAMSI